MTRWCKVCRERAKEGGDTCGADRCAETLAVWQDRAAAFAKWKPVPPALPPEVPWPPTRAAKPAKGKPERAGRAKSARKAKPGPFWVFEGED